MTVGELIDYPQAFSTLFDVLREENYELACRLESQTKMTLRVAASLMQKPEVAIPRLEQALERLRQLEHEDGK